MEDLHVAGRRGPDLWIPSDEGALALLGLFARERRGIAICSDPIFAIGLETAGTHCSASSPDPARVDGTWTFTLDCDGSLRP